MRLFQMRNCFIRLTVESKRPAKIAVCGGEIRVQVDGALELLNRVLSVALRECHAAEREMRPWVALIELRRPRGKGRGPLSLGSMTIQPTWRDTSNVKANMLCAGA